MKSLIVIRHAKSSWDFSALNDFDRPLNERGHKDAPIMAKRLLDKKITIDAFVSSTANRALTTATYFAKAYEVKAEAIVQVPELYHAPPSVFYEVIKNVDAHLNSIAIFSHNPGITDFVNQLTNTRIADMPTCAMFGVTIKTNNWASFDTAEKEFCFFDFPKA